MSEQFQFSFEHTNLKDVDPNRKPVEEGFYTLSLNQAELRTYKKSEVYKSGPNEGQPRPDAGEEATYLNLGFVISDHEKHSGRRMFLTMFPGENTLKKLRKFMDAIEEPMNDVETIPEYLKRIAEAGTPYLFKCQVKQVEGTDREGEPEIKNFVNLWQAQSL